MSRLAKGPMHLPIQGVPGAVSHAGVGGGKTNELTMTERIRNEEETSKIRVYN